MEKFVIEGGRPLSGTITPAGNKNAALPALAASLLTEEEVVVRNVPRIRDVEAMLELLADLGVRVEWRDDNSVCLCAADVTSTDVDPGLAGPIRASFLVAGPLLARVGRQYQQLGERRQSRSDHRGGDEGQPRLRIGDQHADPDPTSRHQAGGHQHHGPQPARADTGVEPKQHHHQQSNAAG